MKLFNLDAEIHENTRIIELCESTEIAKDFYRAMSNMRWRKVSHLTTEEQDSIILGRLKGNYDVNIWTGSWRVSGGIIADIRNKYYKTKEDYTYFYCSGNEGYVSDLVKWCFSEMGWEQSPWSDED